MLASAHRERGKAPSQKKTEGLREAYDSLSEALHDWKYARKCVLGTAVVFGGRERLKLGVWTLVTFPNYNAV